MTTRCWWHGKHEVPPLRCDGVDSSHYSSALLRTCLGWLPLIGCLLASPLYAQTTDSLDVSLLGGVRLGIGTLLQVDATVNEPERTDGFEARVARLRFKGEVERAAFFVQTELTAAPSLLDVRLRVPLNERLVLRLGLYKSPFSASIIQFRGALPLAERPRMINALAPRRQTGGHLAADLIPGALSLDVGIYNGNGRTLADNDNDSFLYVGRVSGTATAWGPTVAWGADAAYSRDASVRIRNTVSEFTGTRVPVGVDLSVTANRWRVLGEAIGVHLSPEQGEKQQPFGYTITAGVSPAEQHEVLLRYDHFAPDAPRTGTLDDRWSLGYTFFVTPSMQLRADYTAAASALGDGTFTGRLQIAIR